MKLKELKMIVANINATTIRIGGFCEEYSQLHDELQLKTDEQKRLILIVNTDFEEDLPVFGSSETKANILALPEIYDNYEVLLHGKENSATDVLLLKKIKKAVRMDDPANAQDAGLCLLGPMFHLPYSVTIVFADTREESNVEKTEDLLNIYEQDDEIFIYHEFWTEQEREEFIQAHAEFIDESVGDRVVRDCYHLSHGILDR